MANVLNISETSKSALEKKLGSQLEQATLDDLLIPSYSYLNEMLYDVDWIERILLTSLPESKKKKTTRPSSISAPPCHTRNLIIIEAAQIDDGWPSVLKREQEEAAAKEGVDDESRNDAAEVEVLGVSTAMVGHDKSKTWRAAVRENQML
ncbi:NPH3 domain containing protein [Trema orientale]|uniref:NPH3 domain containing protein n=1 Tax=Trema orientale TaxID=63057 RepID=A0A2P5ET26_TREOI|nr:NPH3 domain containing protein [Trema orientale]